MLNVNGLHLKQRILQSPMAGCTDLAYRRIARKFGCELAFCEMVKDRPTAEGNARTLEMLKTADDDHPLGMQLVGRDPHLMAEAARRLEQLGADVIDVNLGCPVPKVVKQGCGAALLKEPSLVRTILEAMVAAVKVPVTVKMRTGYDEGDEDRFLEIVRIAGEAGAGAVTVHGRTRNQMFRGEANHDAIRKAKAAATVPVVGNGNIRNGRDAATMIRDTGCDAVMVARGALGNPWLYREIQSYLETGTIPPPPTTVERAEVLNEHFDLLRELYGTDRALILVRRVIHWFVKGACGANILREKGNRVNTLDQFREVIDIFRTADLRPPEIAGSAEGDGAGDAGNPSPAETAAVEPMYSSEAP